MTDLSGIKATFEKLYTELAALMREGDSIVALTAQLDDRERQLRDFEKSLYIKERQYDEKLTKFTEEKQYVARYLKQVKEKELALEQREAQLPDIKKMEMEAQSRIKDARAAEDRLEQRKREFADIEQRVAALTDMKAALDRERTIDRERKQILDIREEKIRREEARLKRLSEIAG